MSYRQIERILGAIDYNYRRSKYVKEMSNKRSQINNQSMNTVVDLSSSKSTSNEHSQSVIVSIKSNTMYTKSDTNPLFTKISLREYVTPIKLPMMSKALSSRKDYNTKAKDQHKFFGGIQQSKTLGYVRRQIQNKSQTKQYTKYKPKLISQESNETHKATGMSYFSLQ